MSGTERRSYTFRSFQLDIAERQLLNDKTPVSLTPKVFDVLAILVQRSGHLVEKEELMQRVWPDSFVEEANISRIVHTLRHALGEDENGNKFIETVAKKGYRFVAKVEEVKANGSDSRSSEPVLDPVRKDAFRRNYPRTVLILIVILAVLMTGCWFVSRRARSSVNGSAVQTNSGEAYQRYQEGRLLIERKSKGDLKKALADFEKAIELDPNYSDAYAGKADAKIWIFWTSRKHDDIVQARASLGKAIELEPSNPYAHTLACRIKATYDWEFENAENECRKALEIDPKNYPAHTELATFLSSVGREDEALSEIKTAIDLAPNSFNKRTRGMILYYSRRYDEAIAQLQQVEATDPDFSMASKWISRSFEMKKDYDRAFEWRLRQVEDKGASPEEVAALKATYAANGWPGVLRNMVDSVGTLEENSPGVNPLEIAIMYVGLGENEKAFEYLNRAYDQREIFMVHIAQEPRLDPIRSDPRFDALVKRIGLKP